MRHSSPFVFGEVLIDCFPDGQRVLGGAPFNVAWHLHAFGEEPLFISRVGSDRDGNSILDAMLKWGMRTDAVQMDPLLPTGHVNIRFSDGEPAYDIVHPSAWDAIAPIHTAGGCSMLYHGSLALRDARSLATLLDVESASGAGVFLDVNLRDPWWNRDQLTGLLQGADWVKLNSDELNLLAPSRDTQALLADYHLQGLILTRGAAGAEIVSRDAATVRVRPADSVEVMDTVGAGDAFASVMLLGLLRDWPMSLTASRAQDFASRMVNRLGATVSDMNFYDDIMEAWLAEGTQAADEGGTGNV